MAHDHRMNPVGEPHLNKVNRMRRETSTDPRNTNDDWHNLGTMHDADREYGMEYGHENLSPKGMESAEDMSYRGHDPAEILYGDSTARSIMDTNYDNHVFTPKKKK
jgi:hypothetical protein